jgi:hypothetical protein
VAAAAEDDDVPHLVDAARTEPAQMLVDEELLMGYTDTEVEDGDEDEEGEEQQEEPSEQSLTMDPGCDQEQQAGADEAEPDQAPRSAGVFAERSCTEDDAALGGEDAALLLEAADFVAAERAAQRSSVSPGGLDRAPNTGTPGSPERNCHPFTIPRQEGVLSFPPPFAAGKNQCWRAGLCRMHLN